MGISHAATSRRDFLKIGATAVLMGGALFQAHAASDPSRIALVVGNDDYRDAPLRNAVNDAKAVATLLKRAGLTVTLKTDLTREALREAAAALATAARGSEAKQVFFYYAGHGAQLDWRNYLLPVDARVTSANDLPQQCLDLSVLLTEFGKAKGKTFVLILDACRDNPFGTGYLPAQKGLSQFDAPGGSLLAFSTAPGSVAADGSGANGLYTGNLVHELSAKGVKLEDALKRVRLAVRLASRGAQIPWESTSLETDIYLFPAAHKPTEEELEEEYQQEMAHWNRIKGSRDVEAWVGYLREYPNGRFSEIAQGRLTTLLSRAALMAAAEPSVVAPAAGSPTADGHPAVAPAKPPTVSNVIEAGLARPDNQVLAQAETSIVEVAEASNSGATPTIVVPSPSPSSVSPEAVPPATIAPAAGASGTAPTTAGQESGSAAHEALVIVVGVPAPVLLRPSRNPYSQGTYPLGRRYSVQDFAEYEETNRLGISETKRVRRYRVTKVDEDNDEIELNRGSVLLDGMGNQLKSGQEAYDPRRQQFPAEIQVGRKWTSRYVIRTAEANTEVYYDFTVKGRERIELPAGWFDAFLIEGEGLGIVPRGRTRALRRYWIAPGVNFSLKEEYIHRSIAGVVDDSRLLVLVSCVQHLWTPA